MIDPVRAAITSARRVSARFGAMRVMLPGLLTVALSLLILASTGPHAGYFPRVAVAFFLFGLGSGSSFIPLLSIAMAKVPKEDAGIASGIVNVSMQISAAIGLALLATLSTDRAQTLSARGESLPDALTGGYHLAFLAAAGSVVIGVGLALLLLRKHAPGPVER